MASDLLRPLDGMTVAPGPGPSLPTHLPPAPRKQAPGPPPPPPPAPGPPAPLPDHISGGQLAPPLQALEDWKNSYSHCLAQGVNAGHISWQESADRSRVLRHIGMPWWLKLDLCARKSLAGMCRQGRTLSKSTCDSIKKFYDGAEHKF